MNPSVDKFKGSKILSVIGLHNGSDEVIFKTDKGDFKMYHSQDCCEKVDIDTVSGVTHFDDALVFDLIEKTNRENPKSEHSEYDYIDESCTWTFYTLITSKGYTDIRWYGTSNGFYSEVVDFDFLGEE